MEADVEHGEKTGNVIATIREVAQYTMVPTEAILELLAEEGIPRGAEVIERVAKVKKETPFQFRWVQLFR